MFLFQYTKTGELIGRLCSHLIDGPFRVFGASLTWRNAMHLRTSFLAFCMATARCMIDEDGVSSLVILELAPKTNMVGTSLWGPRESFMALKDICSAKSVSMSGISVIIID